MPSSMRTIKKVLRPLKRPLYWAERRLFDMGVPHLRDLTLPRFLGLGAPQAGTTWLHLNLSHHPDVFLPEMKETHYFTRQFHEWPLSYYASLFAAGADKVRGEITPGYNLLKFDRIRQIHKILPDARLVLIIRNPIDRAWSSFRRAASREVNRVGSSFDKIDDAKFYKYLERQWAPYWEKAWNYEPGLSHEHYSQQIDRWSQVYPEEQLFVGFFDELKNSPKEFMKKVCQHIGVRTDIDWGSIPLDKIVNRNPEHAIPDRFYNHLKSLYEPEIDRLHSRFGASVEAWRESMLHKSP